MEALLVIGALAGLVWCAVVFLRGGLLAGALIVLLTGSCFGHAFLSIPAPVLPLTADRLLLAVLAGQYLVYRRFGMTDPKPMRAPDWVLLAFIAVLFFSTFSNDWRANGSQPAARLAFFYMMPLVLYWIVRQVSLGRREMLWIFGFLGVFGTYLAITAFAESRGIWWAVFPKYMASAEYSEFYGRGRGPFLNPAGCGIFQGTCLCATLMWWPRVNRRGKLVLTILTLLYCVGIYSTLTRCAWLGGVAGLFVMGGLSMPRRWSVAVLGTASLVGALVVVTQWENILQFKRDKAADATATAESAKLRPLLAAVAWEMFLDRPLLGCGFAQYTNESQPYFSDRSLGLPLEKARRFVQHNAVLSLLTETGLIGAGLFVLLFALWGRDAWRLWRSRAPLWARQHGLLFLATVMVYIPNAMFQDVTIVVMVNMLIFFLAGILEGLVPLAATDAADGRDHVFPTPLHQPV